MAMDELSLRAFAEALAAKAPVPGGGGAAALAAALGAALGGMVSRYTLAREDVPVPPEVQHLLQEAEELRTRLLACVEGDAEAFLPLSAAYRLAPDAPGREAELERCLRLAAAVPMEVLELSCRGILLHKALAEVCSELLQADAGTGVILFWAAMYAAALNVKVNTAGMADRAYAAAMNERVDALMQEHWTIADAVYEAVFQRYS